MRMRGSAWTGAILAGLLAWSAADAVAGWGPRGGAQVDPNKKDKSVVEFDDGTAKKYTIVPDNAVKQLEESMAKAQEKTGKTMKMTVVAKSLTIAQAKDEVAKRNGGDKGTKPGTGANAPAEDADQTDPAAGGTWN